MIVIEIEKQTVRMMLKYLKVLHNTSTVSIAKDIGISHELLSGIEAERLIISDTVMLKFCKHFKLNRYEFYKRVEEHNERCRHRKQYKRDNRII